MSTRPAQRREITTAIADQAGSFVHRELLTLPTTSGQAGYTTISNRGQCTDPSKDLLPRIGVERFHTYKLVEIPNESGPNGEIVHKPLNDFHDHYRFVGFGWTPENLIADPGRGYHWWTSTVGDYVEVTFYGTGLSVLLGFNSATLSSTSLIYNVNGGADSANILSSYGTGSNVLTNAYMSSNNRVSVVSGLTRGLYTVKLRFQASGGPAFHVNGFEILNDSSVIAVTPGTAYVGGKKNYLSALTTTPYDSVFEVGTLGSKGGYANIYLKNDNTIAKSLVAPPASPSYLTAASHANEEIIDIKGWREFGVGRSADFGSLKIGDSADRAWVLDDNHTSMYARDVGTQTASAPADYDLLKSSGTTGVFFRLVFFGSGIDISRIDNSAGTDTYEAFIDGVSVGNLSTTGQTTLRNEKIASGLSLQSHTLTIVANSVAAFRMQITKVIVYGPKKPSVPDGAIELGAYYLMGSYTQVASFSGNTQFNKISAGVLRSTTLRETIPSGTWSYTTGNYLNTGLGIYTSASGAFMDFWFWGTGVELRTYQDTTAANLTFSIDGVTNLSGAGYSTNLVQGSTGMSFVASTGVYSGTSAAVASVSLKISGITLGWHKLRILSNNTGNFQPDAIDVITPLFFPKQTTPFVVQNYYHVGSSSIGDSRRFQKEQLPMPARMLAHVEDAVTGATLITASTYMPLPGLVTKIKTTGNPVKISGFATCYGDPGTNYGKLCLVMDGKVQHEFKNAHTAGEYVIIPLDLVVPASAGWHTFNVMALKLGGATQLNFGVNSDQNRRLMVEEMT